MGGVMMMMMATLGKEVAGVTAFGKEMNGVTALGKEVGGKMAPTIKNGAGSPGGGRRPHPSGCKAEAPPPALEIGEEKDPLEGGEEKKVQQSHLMKKMAGTGTESWVSLGGEGSVEPRRKTACPLSRLKEGKKQRQRSTSNTSSVSLMGVKIWRKKEVERQGWLDQNEKPMHHKKVQQEMKEEKQESEDSEEEDTPGVKDVKLDKEEEEKNVPERGNHAAVEQLLLAQHPVTICSWCFQNREQQVMEILRGQTWFGELEDVFCIQQRTGYGGKATLCLDKGIQVLMDDAPDICKEAFEKGLDVYPIQTRLEKHQWWESIGRTAYPTLADAVKAFLDKEGRNEDEKKEFEESSKKDKGLKTALYLMRTEAAKFCSVSKQTSLESSLRKKEEWLSERQAIDKWGQKDLDKHLESGRVVYRQAAGTWGDVWEYMDTQDYVKALTGKHNKSWLEAQEFEQQPDEEDAWSQLLGKDLMGLLSEQGPGKGAPAKGKGKGKTKTKNQTPQPVEDMAPEEQLHEGLKKMKKLRSC
eukprot:s3841_g16.t1